MDWVGEWKVDHKKLKAEEVSFPRKHALVGDILRSCESAADDGYDDSGAPFENLFLSRFEQKRLVLDNETRHRQLAGQYSVAASVASGKELEVSFLSAAHAWQQVDPEVECFVAVLVVEYFDFEVVVLAVAEMACSPA